MSVGGGGGSWRFERSECMRFWVRDGRRGNEKVGRRVVGGGREGGREGGEGFEVETWRARFQTPTVSLTLFVTPRSNRISTLIFS